jgi:hypothetical protein
MGILKYVDNERVPKGCIDFKCYFQGFAKFNVTVTIKPNIFDQIDVAATV